MDSLDMFDPLIPKSVDSVSVLYGTAAGAATVLIDGDVAATTVKLCVPTMVAGQRVVMLLQRRVLTVIGTVGGASVAPVVWHLVGATGEPAFANGWVNYDATTGHPAGFCKDAYGFVHIRGLIRAGTVGWSTPVFTLPLGYRPARAVTVPVVANNVFGVGEVMPDGSVFVGIGSSAYTYLDSVQFHV